MQDRGIASVHLRPAVRYERNRSHQIRFLVTSMMLVAIGACADTRENGVLAPPAPPTTQLIQDNEVMATALTVVFQDPSADSVRAEYQSADRSDTGTTPWFASSSGALPVLGLRPSTTYLVTLQSRRGSEITNGTTVSQTTSAMPAPLQGVSMTRVSGSLPSHGYTLTALIASDGNGYAVAFDSTGTLRWYRGIGAHDVMETKQQKNGDFTIYVGSSRGFDPWPGAYVEVTARGDSVRTVRATGSPYTDPHELIVTSDRFGNRIADYLFGYDIQSVDLSGAGGPSSADRAGHQVIRVAASGAVDTLVNGWAQWSQSDYTNVFSSQDIDHPNAITFDVDGEPVISFRDVDAIIKVDSVTHKVNWQLGGARNQFRFVNDPLGGFSGQHSVRVLPNGHLLMLDNGTNHTPQTSRVVEYAVNSAAKTATLVWQYNPQPPLFNSFTGSAQRIANGNTGVGWTQSGYVDEVSPSADLVSRMQIWSAPATPAVSIYRAIRINNLYAYADP